MINQDQLLSATRSILAIVGGWAVGRGYISQDQLVLVGGVLASLIPLAWGLYAHTPDSTVKAAERALGPGEKIVVNSQARADELAPRDAAGEPAHDKILSPSEDLTHVADSPGVVAVVLKSASAADANPSVKVIGPAAIVPVPIPATTKP